MEITQKAIAKAVSSHGTYALNRKAVFCTLLDDMIPEQIEDLKFIKMVYTDEIGQLLTEALQAPFSDKEKYYMTFFTPEIINFKVINRGVREMTITENHDEDN